jgi:hypothetical protein
VANLRVSVPVSVAPVSRSQAKLICGGLTATLPWWPDEIAWSEIAESWTEQTRPGRAPLLLKETSTLPEVSVGFIASTRDQTMQGDGGSIQPMLDTLSEMASSDTPVQLLLGSNDQGRFRIIDLSYTELDHAPNGEPSKVEVSLVLKTAQDASAPIGPIPSRKKKKKKKR